jgi:nucleoside-diphosphate-sugar epimerase
MAAAMRAFVTGGSGFVGRNLIRTLIGRGDEVVALARSDRAAQQVEEAGGEVVRGDLDACEESEAAMKGCDVVFHSAAVVTDWGDPKYFERVNVTGTGNMLAAARAAGVPRFVHIGTEAVLVGGPPIVQADETWALPKRPIGLYPQTKGRAETLVREANDDALTTVVVRPRFIWGRDDTSLMPQLIESVNKGEFRWVSGGDYLTSTCHVDNVVEGALLAAEKGVGGEIYFLTDGEPVQMKSFLTAMMATRDVTPKDRNVPRWVARSLAWTLEGVWRLFRIGRRPPLTRSAIRLIGEEVTVVDAKARAELGYQGLVTHEQGLAEMRELAQLPGSK